MLGALSSWLYDRDPFEPLRFEKPLADLRKRLASCEPVFQDLMKKYLISNGHRVTVKSLPDPELEEKIRQREIAELKAVRDKRKKAAAKSKNLEESKQKSEGRRSLQTGL